MLRVMLVEDSFTVRTVYCDLFSRIVGLNVVGEYASAGAAIAAVRAHPPDIILLDIQLEDGDGLEVLRWVRQEYPEVLVVVATNFADPVQRKEYAHAGACVVYDKSRDFKDLAHFFTTLVHQETPAEAAPRSPEPRQCDPARASMCT